eukprot:CAMPEP_0119028028 /NCGR_PEP_ID=MMETSP1176-20130426/38188_1 /TAXON_ID=265551 /ORGANISM="Synedropsis recta cf, Strain CCMP1620" /LENGTH=131 /DNA_ID=CAMNT_0006984079 /DNA_START=134 /DNA_END=530 /DNA_ORIENTATION=-
MPSPLMYHTHRRSRSSSRRVSFTEFVEVNEYRPLHPELKSALYYSREEMHEIRRRAKAVIAMRRQRQLVDWKMRNIQISPAMLVTAPLPENKAGIESGRPRQHNSSSRRRIHDETHNHLKRIQLSSVDPFV